MSSVGSSDSSSSSKRNDEVTRRNREDYRKNESEQIKKHQRELRRLNEQHYSQLEELKQSHASQMENLREASHDALSGRDQKYQEDVEGLRDLHRKQLEQSADENQRKDESLRRSTTTELKQTKAQSDARFERLNQDYRAGLEKTEKNSAEVLAEARKSQAEGIAQNRSRLESDYQVKYDALKDERNQTVGHLQNEGDKYRQNAEGRLKSQQLHHFGDQQRSSENMIRAVQHEREARQDSEEMMREGFTEGLGKMRDRFDKAASKESDAMRMSRENLESDVSTRVVSKLDRLERDKMDLKEKMVHDQVKINFQKQREINNVADAYQKNMENYKEQRDEAVRQGNERNHRDVAEIRKEMEGHMSNNTRFYQGKMNEENRIQRGAYDNLKQDTDLRSEQTRLLADQRVKSVFEKSTEEKARLTEMSMENHSATQRVHQDEMKALRDQLETDKQVAVGRLTEQLKKQEIGHTERMGQVVSKYEKQIVALKDQMMRDRKINEENLKRSVEDLQRVHKLGLDQIEAQNRDRLRQLQAHQDQEIRSVNKRHEEKLDSVLVEVKKS